VAKTPKYELYGLCGAGYRNSCWTDVGNTTLRRMFTRYADAISNRMDWFEKQTTELCTISPLLLVFVGFKVAVAIQIPISGALLTLAPVVQSTFNNKKP
jgi:hypothetical protein